MYLQAVVWTVLAWFAGLILDANLSIQPAGFLCLLPLPPLLFFLSHICYGICIASLVCVLYYQCLCCHSLPLFLSAALSVFPCVPLSCSGVWFYRAGCFSH